MSYNIASSWRGVVGLIKPTFRPGSLEEIFRLLPEGIGVIPLYLGIKSRTKEEFTDALGPMKEIIAELARLKVDLIESSGSAVTTLKGYKGEQEILRGLEEEYGIPISTSPMAFVEAFKALGIKKMIGVTYNEGAVTESKYSYYTEAGLEVLEIGEMSVKGSIPFAEVGRISSREVYAFTKKLYLKHQNAQGIILHGGGWRILDIIPVLEQDLQVPVICTVTAEVWAIQKRLHVRQPIKGYGRLLEEMP